MMSGERVAPPWNGAGGNNNVRAPNQRSTVMDSTATRSQDGTYQEWPTLSKSTVPVNTLNVRRAALQKPQVNSTTVISDNINVSGMKQWNTSKDSNIHTDQHDLTQDWPTLSKPSASVNILQPRRSAQQQPHEYNAAVMDDQVSSYIQSGTIGVPMQAPNPIITDSWHHASRSQPDNPVVSSSGFIATTPPSRGRQSIPSQHYSSPPIKRQLERLSLDSKIRSTEQYTDILGEDFLPQELAVSSRLQATLLRDLHSDILEKFELLFKMLMMEDIANADITIPELIHVPKIDRAKFAVSVLTRTERQLLSLGPQICELLSRQKNIQTWAPNLARSLAARAAAVTVNTLHGRNIPQIPFRDHTDSRRHFKTPEQQQLYANREHVRDKFLTCLNRVISSQNSLSAYYYSVNDNSLHILFRECIQFLYPDNISWFAHLFVELLLNISGDDREFDKEVTSLAKRSHGTGQGTDRIDKLSRRMDGRVDVDERNRPVGAPSSADLNDIWDDLFPRPAERFFPLFLFVVDSHRLSLNVQLCCEAYLDKMSSNLASHPKDDLNLTERIARCNVVGKFLGFLTHYPRFESTKSAADNRMDSIAFESLHIDLVEEANRTRPLGLDLREVLVKAACNGYLTLVVPWVARFLLAGAARDFAARESIYIKETFIILDLIRTGGSRTMKLAMERNLGFSYLRMITEIDTLMAVFGFVPDKNDSVYQSVYEKWPRLVDSLDKDIKELDTFHAQFDTVPLDRIATTCVPLERLRILLSLASLPNSITASFDKTKLRRITSSLAQDQQDDTPQLITHHVPQNQVDTTSIILDEIRQSIAASFLHHQEEAARVVEFAVLTTPSNIQAALDSFLSERIKTFKSQDRVQLGWEDAVLESAMHRAFYQIRSFVEPLVNLVLSQRPLQLRDAVVHIATGKVEITVEKLLRRRITELSEGERKSRLK